MKQEVLIAKPNLSKKDNGVYYTPKNSRKANLRSGH